MLQGTESLKSVYDAYIECRGFRHYIEITHGRVKYYVGLDTEYLDERDRARRDIEEQVGIPSHVTFNGETYPFSLTVFSIRETGAPYLNAERVYDGGYPDEHSFQSFEYGNALAEAGYEYDTSIITGCDSCGMRNPQDKPDGGMAFEPDAEGEVERYCLPCAFEMIGRSDLQDSLPTSIAERMLYQTGIKSGGFSNRAEFVRLDGALYGHTTELKERFKDVFNGEGSAPSWCYVGDDSYRWMARSGYVNDVAEAATEVPFGKYTAIFQFGIDRYDDTLPPRDGSMKYSVNAHGVRGRNGQKPRMPPEWLRESVREWTKEADGYNTDRPDRCYLAVTVGARGGVRDVELWGAFGAPMWD